MRTLKGAVHNPMKIICTFQFLREKNETHTPLELNLKGVSCKLISFSLVLFSVYISSVCLSDFLSFYMICQYVCLSVCLQLFPSGKVNRDIDYLLPTRENTQPTYTCKALLEIKLQYFGVIMYKLCTKKRAMLHKFSIFMLS